MLKQAKEVANASKIDRKSVDLAEKAVKKRVQAIFNGFDRDNDGFISYENIIE